MAQGVQVNVAYTWSKAFGICCDTLSDGSPRVQALEYFDLNEALLPQDRPHNFQASFVARAAVRRREAVLEQWRRAAAILGGWQVNGLFGAYSGSPFTVESAATSLDMNGSNQMADQVKDDGRNSRRHRSRQAVVRHDGVPARDRAPIRHGSASTACAAPATPTST